jgi:hypothetical protein
LLLESRVMSATLPQPIPSDLREQLIERVMNSPDKYLPVLFEAFLHAEKVRLLDEISADAEREQAEGKWDNLPALIQQVREGIKSARRSA